MFLSSKYLTGDTAANFNFIIEPLLFVDPVPLRRNALDAVSKWIQHLLMKKAIDPKKRTNREQKILKRMRPSKKVMQRVISFSRKALDAAFLPALTFALFCVKNRPLMPSRSNMPFCEHLYKLFTTRGQVSRDGKLSIPEKHIFNDNLLKESLLKKMSICFHITDLIGSLRTYPQGQELWHHSKFISEETFEAFAMNNIVRLLIDDTKTKSRRKAERNQFKNKRQRRKKRSPRPPQDSRPFANIQIPQSQTERVPAAIGPSEPLQIDPRAPKKARPERHGVDRSGFNEKRWLAEQRGSNIVQRKVASSGRQRVLLELSIGIVGDYMDSLRVIPSFRNEGTLKAHPEGPFEGCLVLKIEGSHGLVLFKEGSVSGRKIFVDAAYFKTHHHLWEASGPEDVTRKLVGLSRWVIPFLALGVPEHDKPKYLRALERGSGSQLKKIKGNGKYGGWMEIKISGAARIMCEPQLAGAEADWIGRNYEPAGMHTGRFKK